MRLAAYVVYSVITAAVAGAQGAPRLPRAAALDIMKEARYATLVTVGEDGQPQARIVDPLLTDDPGSIWIATNPLSRKVAEIKRNHRVTLLFFNTPKNEFVTVLARATIVTNSAAKAKQWKPEWTPFYKSGPGGRDVALFEVKPFQLEIVTPDKQVVNDVAEEQQ